MKKILCIGSVTTDIMLSPVDEGVFKKLGMHLTCEPKTEAKDDRK